MKLKDASGKEINKEEWMSRWKAGMQEVTPLQTTQFNMYGYYLILVGIIVGIVTAILTKAWWLLIILLGSFIVSGTATLGNYQKLVALRKLDSMMKEDTMEVKDK